MRGSCGSGIRGRGCDESLYSSPLPLATADRTCDTLPCQNGEKGAAVNSVTCPEDSIVAGVRNERVNVP